MAIPAVEQPSRNKAAVSLVLRPKRRWMAMPPSVPSGRTMKATANSAKASKVPSSRSTNGKNTDGNTSTEAMP